MIKKKQNIVQKWFQKKSFTYLSYQSEDEFKKDLKKHCGQWFHFFAEFKGYYEEGDTFTIHKTGSYLGGKIYIENNKTYIELNSISRIFLTILIFIMMGLFLILLTFFPNTIDPLAALIVMTFMIFISIIGYFPGKAVKANLRACFAKQFKLTRVETKGD